MFYVKRRSQTGATGAAISIPNFIFQCPCQMCFLLSPHKATIFNLVTHFKRRYFNPLTPNDLYMGRTAPLTPKRWILYIYSTNIGTEYFKHALYSPIFSLQNAVCFIMLTCLDPVLFTFYIQGVLKLKKNNSGAKGLTLLWYSALLTCIMRMFQIILALLTDSLLTLPFELLYRIDMPFRSQLPRGLRRGSADARLLKLWFRIPPGAWMSVCCECCVLSGRGLWDGLITRPEESC